MAKTNIEWADYTFNPWVGCTKVSEGCKFCYAEELMTNRFKTVEWGPSGTRKKTSPANWKKPITWNKQAEKEGVRYKVFCASLADVFEDREELEDWRDELFNLIEATPHLDWLLLTKRPQNVYKMVDELWWEMDRYGSHSNFPDNVWIGTSVEDQKTANKRIPHLLRIPAKVRFLSCEPLLGPVNLTKWLHQSPLEGGAQGAGDVLHWVIVGGESGNNARPMHPSWATSLRDQCKEADIPFFFKQWGRWGEWNERRVPTSIVLYNDGSQYPIGKEGFLANPEFDKSPVVMVPVGKKQSGRILNGKTHNEFPALQPPTP